MLNINPGFNLELMEHCRTLREYMAYVGHGTEICKGNRLSGGSGPSNPGMSRKRNFGGFSLQELGGGEKSEHL